MLSAVVFVVTVLVVGGLVFLGGSLLLGRGETRPPADPDRSPLELPEDRPVTADDLRAARISVTVRGYRMTEVDWLVEQLAQTLEERDAQLAELRRRLDDTAAPARDDVPPRTPTPEDGTHADA
ncbi:DivIVA domain-containing protein [Geodermatophilus sp. SYSU D00079]